MEGVIIIEGTEIYYNKCQVSAGAVHLFDSTGHIINSHIHNNTVSTVGGGIELRYSNATIQASNIHHNACATKGGGVVVDSDSTVSITESHIHNNQGQPGEEGHDVYCVSKHVDVDAASLEDDPDVFITPEDCTLNHI